MDSMFEDDISILTQEALGPDEDWLDSPNTDLSGEMCSASHFALITAYDDIKNRLTGLERENSTLKRRLKMYEVKYPLISEFGEEHIFSLYEAKETSLLKSEKASLQQQLNQFQHEDMDSMFEDDISILTQEALGPDEDWLDSPNTDLSGEMCSASHFALITAYDDIKNRLTGLERENSTLKRRLKMYEVKELTGGRAGPALSAAVTSGVSVSPGVSQRLSRTLRVEAPSPQPPRGPRETASPFTSPRRIWVNLALAYTELTEELCRLRNLSSLQSQILRALLQEKSLNGGQRHSPLSQCHSPAQQRRSPAPQCPSPAPPGRSPAPQCQSPALQRRSPGPPSQSPAQQRRSPAPAPCQSPAQQRRSPVPPPSSQSPAQQRRSPVPPPCPSPASASPHRLPGERMELGYAKPSSRHIKAGFQGRRSYSEVTNVALYQQNRSLWLQPEASTLPKHRPYGEVYLGGGAGAPLSSREPFEEHLRFEKQSSDEEEWALPSPPSPEAGAIRCASFCAGFPVPDAEAAHRTAAAYARAEHAQSWPSINVSMVHPPPHHNPPPGGRHIKAGFQGRRSYSEVTNVALYQQNRSLWLQPEASTLPKHRPYGEVYLGGGAGAPLSSREPFEEHLRFEKQSSDEEEWALPSPPSPEAGAIRCASFCAGFPVPDAEAAHRTAAAYARAEHAQSWPSINQLGAGATPSLVAHPRGWRYREPVVAMALAAGER
ncbi:PREDICTED: TANK-binding kinase 1-binding protein 1 [Calidris pugnax]|uniref:TANK-binding kinase 1-binding protein 1 n=1 Tax=Calidris pugnax TaxID=198806 RepID=UPI00071D54D5|nr:PREDICTED: TANK-binding kinase 1-binding protein 1 [Calidris pugnax]